MKSKIVWQAIFLFSVLFTLQSCFQSASMAVKGDDCRMNGDFEITKQGLPVNWNYYTSEKVPDSDFDIVTDNTISVKGNNSLRFTIRKCESIGGWHSPGFFKEFKVQPGEIYNVSFWAINKGCMLKVRAETGMKGIPGISETVVSAQETFSDWKYYSHAIQIPENNDNIRLEVNILSPGTIWFDDVRIEGVTDTTERKVYPYREDQECK